MCIKLNKLTKKSYSEQEILQQLDKIKKIVRDNIQQEKFEKYELVRQQGYFNMLDPRARKLTGLNKEDYKYILKNYTKLISKFPDTKHRVKLRLDYIKSANIAKIVAIKGCKNCIEIVSKKLDVTEQDLCENCKKILTEI